MSLAWPCIPHKASHSCNVNEDYSPPDTAHITLAWPCIPHKASHSCNVNEDYSPPDTAHITHNTHAHSCNVNEDYSPPDTAHTHTHTPPPPPPPPPPHTPPPPPPIQHTSHTTHTPFSDFFCPSNDTSDTKRDDPQHSAANARGASEGGFDEPVGYTRSGDARTGVKADVKMAGAAGDGAVFGSEVGIVGKLFAKKVRPSLVQDHTTHLVHLNNAMHSLHSPPPPPPPRATSQMYSLHITIPPPTTTIPPPAHPPRLYAWLR
jgi:hypothetical protein